MGWRRVRMRGCNIEGMGFIVGLERGGSNIEGMGLEGLE